LSSVACVSVIGLKKLLSILNSKSNYDNQFILDYLSKYKVGIVNKKLFYYRLFLNAK
jgi:hypothetical protein